MAWATAEQQWLYLERRSEKYPKIACACGCGTLIPSMTKSGKTAKYAHGHNPDGRFKEGHCRLGPPIGFGTEHPAWRGGESYDLGGYVRITLSPKERNWPTVVHDAQSNGRKIKRSHLTWNRYYPDDAVQPGECIHHSNEIRNDDRIENLIKMTIGEHVSFHNRER